MQSMTNVFHSAIGFFSSGRASRCQCLWHFDGSGVSSPQIDNPALGFQLPFDGPLDMRMDTTQGTEVAEWLAKPETNQIAEVIREYGEERFAGAIAKALVARRQARGQFQPPLSWPSSWLAQSKPASRARTLQRAHFRLFGFSSTPSLKSCNKR